MALTAKQQRFVEEYLKDLNGTQAAIRAGYSQKTAAVIAAENLTKPNVQAAIAEGMQKRSSRTGITADRVLQELGRLAFVDIRRAYNADGSLKPLHELDDDTAAAVAGMDVTEIGTGDDAIGFVKKIKLSDKKGALELVMRHLGMLSPPGHVDLDAELKRIEIEKRRIELVALKAGLAPQQPVTKIEIEVVGGRQNAKAPDDGASSAVLPTT
ncbi:terminase small subunit [Pseudomonas sp. SLFW]|uniref:terminase small subunit n=1 Tax=Pseudomonas sp. SLFW TaxID=2683259 RepID=UPI0014125A30|nr:terminase small subunit [Pseudomonas sp. SLFW]NBB11809.1 terminase small subunit [Pseudomonas sp. SLFW]